MQISGEVHSAEFVTNQVIIARGGCEVDEAGCAHRSIVFVCDGPLQGAEVAALLDKQIQETVKALQNDSKQDSSFM